MTKAAINKTFQLSATGILDINDYRIAIENGDTGELIDLTDLLYEFANKPVKLSVTYEYDYS